METLVCPTCGCSLVRLGISKEKATKHSHDGKEYLFCCQGCADVFAADPEIRLEETKDLIACPTCLAEKPPQSADTLEYVEQEIHFCRCPHCLDVFRKAPDYYLKRLQGAEEARQAGDREVMAAPEENDILKRLSRRRRRLVNERGCVINSLHADLQAVAPGLLQITREVGNLWFLNFLTCRKGLLKLARRRRASLLKVPGIGATYADASLVGDMIQQDAARILELKQQIKALEEPMARIAESSSIAGQLASIPGYGSVSSAELAVEIGTVERFRSESSLALYLGMATLDNSSGKYRGSKAPKHVNARAKAAMTCLRRSEASASRRQVIAVDHHRKWVPQSQRYYEKKRAEGKRHNQAIRALGRHLCRVIFKMLTQERPYRIEP